MKKLSPALPQPVLALLYFALRNDRPQTALLLVMSAVGGTWQRRALTGQQVFGAARCQYINNFLGFCHCAIVYLQAIDLRFGPIVSPMLRLVPTQAVTELLVFWCSEMQENPRC